MLTNFLKKNNNFHIIITITSAVVIAILVLYFVTDEFRSNYDIQNIQLWQEQFFLKEFDQDKKQIFLLGSSHTAQINATLVQEIISKEYQNYKIYNLAIKGDVPSTRLSLIDELISSKPEFVFYGIDFRHIVAQIKVESTSPIPKVTNQLPSTENDFDFLPKVEFFNQIPFDEEFLGIGWKNFKNPKLISLKIIDLFSGKKIQVYNKDSNHPFFQEATFSQTLNETQLQNILKPQEERPGKEYQKNSLEKLIKKLKENNIRVIIFITPHHKIFVDSLPNYLRDDFFSYLNKISDEYDVPVISLVDKYDNENVWSDPTHIAGGHPDTLIFNNDVAEMILKEINP